MSNKLLKRALDRLDQFPKKEVEKLVRMQIAEADMLDAILEEMKWLCLITNYGNY